MNKQEIVEVQYTASKLRARKRLLVTLTLVFIAMAIPLLGLGERGVDILIGVGFLPILYLWVRYVVARLRYVFG